ncbi:hypothetical protein UPYG_G00291850 [Umbra pygmaea]|uniref:Solute carrier family 22 member 23 n=1 Tax=Umbra pygmaea TaxID=75934 RepID=A0ABD0W4Y1_UMBPY
MSETAMAVVQLETEDHQPENGFVSPETESPGSLARIDGSVLPFLGGFGKYQKQLMVLTWIPALFIGFSQYSDEFLLAQPNNTCVKPMANITNLTRSPSSLIHGSNSSFPRTAAYVYNNGTHNETARQLQHCMCKEWTFELHTGLMQNVVTKWSLVCDSAWKVHIAKFSLLVGSIFGYLVFGVLADWFGRHPVMIISVLFMLVFGLTVAFSVNVPMFSTLRFFEGFCLAGIILSLYILRIELCLPAWRFPVTMVASFVVLGGQLLMPGMAYLCGDWQILQAVIICPLLLMLSYIWVFPESLRWLLATQQYGRSKPIMEHILQKNQVNTDQDNDHILTELHKALPRKPKKTCIVKMVGTRNLWKNIVVLCVNSLTGYGIHHCFARSMMDHHETHESTMFHNFYADYYTMAGIAVFSCMALCPAVGLMGRRGGLLMFMIITALASLLQLGLLNLLGKYSVHLNIERSDTLNKNFSIAFSIIGMFSSHAVSNLSIFFCAEITPTVIRGGGLGLVLASAGFGMLTAPIMELHNQKGYFLHHIIFACCTLICIICILLLPETRYQPLPETLADGEIYTRAGSAPLLPPRKTGEQRLLLARPEGGREHSRVHDTPQHDAAAAAASTMESTASSAVDLTAPMSSTDIELTLLQTETGPNNNVALVKKDLNGRSGLPLPGASKAALDKKGVLLASKECLSSSTPRHGAPTSSDPLLKSTEDDTDLSLINSVGPPSTFSVQDETVPSHSKDVIKSTPTTTMEASSPSIIESTATVSLEPSILSNTESISTSLETLKVIEPPPTSTLSSSIIEQTPMLDSTIPSVITNTLQVDSTTHPVPEGVSPSDFPDRSDPDSIIEIVLDSVDDKRPPSPPSTTDCNIPLVPDSIQTELVSSSPCVKAVVGPPLTPVQPHPLTPPPPSSNDLVQTPTATVDSSIPPVIDTVDTPTVECTTPPITNIVQPHPSDSTTPLQSLLSNSTDSETTGVAPASTIVDCNNSSPIDLGILPIIDCTIPENSVINGVASS